ncbi:MAG: Cof-type HAD-IIB family hydrolase [Spirochaetaceae bacterium]|jgi:Cof subfamily protein (haloacid dehalogenase superfamily)|nr:Cof-type HAD-IIB family hydrolase [Spirochaetaceae bacterium]
MCSVRLIALDLDDTLLRTDLTISYRTRKAVKRCIAAGIAVVLASGRTYSAMRRYVKMLSLHKNNSYLICGNGSIIQEAATGNIVYHVTLPPKAALAAFDLADAEGFAVQIYEDEVVYVSRENEFAAYEKKLTGMHQAIPDNFREMISGGCHKLVIPGDPMLLKQLETILLNFIGDALTIFTSKPYYLEILPPAADKGSALSKIAEMSGIEQCEVMALGDSMNDEAMIRWAGCGVAMRNGDERIKKIADIVTDKSNDEDGAARIIEQYALPAAALHHRRSM